jgi:glycosyltransferase involved in cell wall biosynthesis
LEIARLIANCDAGLMVLANIPAFYYGTSPNKFFDYISCGIPVINNYPGWIAEMIHEFNCGIAVPPDNPDALAQSLCQLADDRAKFIAMGQQSLRLSKNFTRSNLALQFCEVLESASRKGGD